VSTWGTSRLIFSGTCCEISVQAPVMMPRDRFERLEFADSRGVTWHVSLVGPVGGGHFTPGDLIDDISIKSNQSRTRHGSGDLASRVRYSLRPPNLA
jgi:hypothetical protein